MHADCWLENCCSGAENDRGDSGHRQCADKATGSNPLVGGVIDLYPPVFKINRSPPILGGSECFQWRALGNPSQPLRQGE